MKLLQQVQDLRIQAILELKEHSRGNTANIDTVRIWLSGENEFKSFKTEQGWIR